MSEGVIQLSHRELDRLQVIQAVERGDVTQKEAAEQLSLCVRQVKRLVRSYRHQGAEGLISGHRGKAANNAIPQHLKEQIMALVQTHYADFRPTLACEKIIEVHGLNVSRETLRQWMIQAGLWRARSRKKPRIHQGRPRRPCFGELIQIDGSPHDWFEGRAPRCTLIVFIDDATSRLTALRFVPAETTQAYMICLQEHLVRYGRPVALYSDKHSIFRVSNREDEGEPTQFTRAVKTLDIEPIHAHTPQAKGRVERANQTLQDRLVKELRLRGINDMESANLFLALFIEDYNARFGCTPANPVDAHRPILHTIDELTLIFSQHHRRKISKNLTLQFANIEYQLIEVGKGYRLRSATVTVCEAFDGVVTLLYEGRTLAYRVLCKGEAPIPVTTEKTVDQGVTEAKHQQRKSPKRKQAPDHPWRRQVISGALPAQTFGDTLR